MQLSKPVQKAHEKHTLKRLLAYFEDKVTSEVQWKAANLVLAKSEKPAIVDLMRVRFAILQFWQKMLSLLETALADVDDHTKNRHLSQLDDHGDL